MLCKGFEYCRAYNSASNSRERRQTRKDKIWLCSYRVHTLRGLMLYCHGTAPTQPFPLPPQKSCCPLPDRLQICRLERELLPSLNPLVEKCFLDHHIKAAVSARQREGVVQRSKERMVAGSRQTKNDAKCKRQILRWYKWQLQTRRTYPINPAYVLSFDVGSEFVWVCVPG